MAKSIRLNFTHLFIINVPNKRELQQSVSFRSSVIDFKDFSKATLVSDNPSLFTKNLLERILKLIMTIDDKIRDEKLQHNINTEAAKISGLSSGKIDKYEYLKGEEILLWVIKRAKFTNSFLRKALEKQLKSKEKNKLKL